MQNVRKSIIETEEKNLLKGKVKCGSCGHLLRRKNGKEIYYFCCMAHVIKENLCFKDRITQSTIVSLLADILETYGRLWNEVNDLEPKDSSKKDKDRNHYDSIEQQYKKEIKNLKEQELFYYEQFVFGKITKEKYFFLKERCSEKICKLSNMVTTLQEKKSVKLPQEDTRLHLIKKYIEQYLDSICVYDNNRIEIILKNEKSKAYCLT